MSNNPSACAGAPRRGAVKFPEQSEFYREMKQRIGDYFTESGRRHDGGTPMILKSLVMLAWVSGGYALLMFWATTWWQLVPLAMLLGVGVAGVGFNIQHDAGHGAYSRYRWVNRLAAFCLDLVGGSSYVWDWKHNKIHHQYPNVDGIDEDLNAGPFIRMAPTQRRRFYHRVQFVYAFLLYGWLAVKWHMFDDFANVLRGRLGNNPMPRPRGRALFVFLAGKAAFLFWAVGLPLWRHPFLAVLAGYLIAAVATGLTLSVVFQLAHCVEEAEFTHATAAGVKLPRPWAEHQVATSVDFAQRNPLLTWFLGGLNFQTEHHLFPFICHIHYPALAPIVRDTCRKHGVPYTAHRTLWGGISSHVRFLYRLGHC